MASLSVIVPLYNAERYIDGCLDSLASQTLRDIEVICVNDGSPDRSREIAAKRADGDGRIRILDKENGGPSSARNVGIRAATADYVCFLDSDDTFEDCACERILEAFRSGTYDVVVFGGNCLPTEHADRRIVDALSPRAAEYPTFDPALLFEDRTHPYIRFAIRKSLIVENNLFFDEELRVGEEEALVFNLFPLARGVKVIPDKLYNYYQMHEGSQMNTATQTAARQCEIDQGVAEHVFRDCKRNGMMASYPVQMLWWSVRFSAYSVLRQEPSVRNPLVVRVRKMWLDNCTDDQLAAAAQRPSLAHLVAIILDARDDGAVAADERELASALRRWRLEEYGILDAAKTALERL